LTYLDCNDQLKFVICSSEDYAWAKEKISRYDLHKQCEIFFSPAMGQSNLTPVWLANKILQDRLPVRFQIQLHKILWGNTPGK
jgi:7-carboxy-7-deazaguanine synthase